MIYSSGETRVEEATENGNFALLRQSPMRSWLSCKYGYDTIIIILEYIQALDLSLFISKAGMNMEMTAPAYYIWPWDMKRAWQTLLKLTVSAGRPSPLLFASDVCA